MLGNIYNNTTTSGGGDASIDDSTSSVTGTYSSAKIDSDNAAQDTAQAAKYEIDANAIVSPAGITFDPSSTHNSIIMNPAAVANEYGSITMLGSVCIGKDTTKGGHAFSSVAIGNDSLKAGGSTSSVHIGNNAGATCFGSNFVHIGAGTGISDGGEGLATAIRKGDIAIGTFSGMLDGRNLNRDHTTFIGHRCNDAMKNYDNVTDITVSDYDIIIGASSNNIGANNNRPLIHANGDDDGSTPHWSPGKAADLGTSVNLWQNIYLSGTINLPNSTSISGTGAIFSTSATVQVGGIKIKTDKIEIGGTSQFITNNGTTGMYEHGFWANEGGQGQNGGSHLPANTAVIAYVPSTAVSASTSLGNNVDITSVTPVGSGTLNYYSYFQNTSGESRVWRVDSTGMVTSSSGSPLTGASFRIILSPNAPSSKSDSGPSNSVGSAFGYKTIGGSSFQKYWDIGATILVPEDYYVWVYIYTSGTVWSVSQPDSGAELEATCITITELAM